MTKSILVLGVVLALAWPASAPAQPDKVNLQLSWLPVAEFGCFYQAAATGLYAKSNLDVDIRAGGPQVNTLQILASGAVDFATGGNTFNSLNYAKNDIPMLAVAAVFQKDPQAVLAHSGVGHDTLESLKGVPTLVSSNARPTWWNFLRVKFGFDEDQTRPYTFNLAPFFANKMLAQQGFITNEPYRLELAGVTANVFLLADYGYSSYANTIDTSRALVERNPDLVQRFVNATIDGCYSYLHGDPAPAFSAILAANSEMTPGTVAYGHEIMRDRAMIDGGDASRLGIGAMTDGRYKAFFETMIEAGLYSGNLDYKRGYTLRFVNKRHGLPAN